MALIEKSSDMTERYQGGVDTWGNRERKLYQKIFKKAVELVKENLIQRDSKEYLWYDVGAGGGNIWDTVLENSDDDHRFKVAGCELVEAAVRDLNERYSGDISLGCTQLDLEKYSSDKAPDLFRKADVLSFIDVIYYLGESRDYRETLDLVWKDITPGTIIVVADSLIPYQRRSYFSTKEDCETLYSYTDYTEKVSEEVTDNGKVWHRYLKVKIYRKS